MFPDINSTEDEIVVFCKQEAGNAPGYGHEMKLNYGLNLLSVKQQKKLVDDQNEFNKKILGLNTGLVRATWALAGATIILALIDWRAH
jgi:hypothetical protein